MQVATSANSVHLLSLHRHLSNKIRLFIEPLEVCTGPLFGPAWPVAIPENLSLAQSGLSLAYLKYYTVFQKSDAKIQITITTAYLFRITYPLSGFNYDQV